MGKRSKNLKRKLSLSLSVDTNVQSNIVDSSTECSSISTASPEVTVNDKDLVSAAEALTSLNRPVTPPPKFDSAVSSPVPKVDFKQEYQESTEVPPSEIKKSKQDQEPYIHKKPIVPEHPLVTKVAKVSKHPIVTNAVKYYENSKKNYAKFNYAAEIVEKAAIPVVNKIEVNLNNRYQAKQLKKEASSAAAARKKRKVINSDNMSIETKKRIYFCLHILRLANENINSKVAALQTKINDKEKEIKMQRQTSIQNNQDLNVLQESNPNEAVQQTKTEIVGTVKKIIHLISNFKPSSLSSQNLSPVSSHSGINSDVETDAETLELKLTIRDIILKLPNKIQQCSIPSGTSEQANDKIILFAKESLEMISKLSNVFNNQLSKAENWVGGEEGQINVGDSTPTALEGTINSIKKVEKTADNIEVDSFKKEINEKQSS